MTLAEPDYFANRKLVEFFDGIIVPIAIKYNDRKNEAGICLEEIEKAFQKGAKLFVFSNPNNPVGVIYSDDEITAIAKLAKKYDVSSIVDQLYSRQIFDQKVYIHLCAQQKVPENLITIIGPSKTESLSGFRLGVAFGTSEIIARMEKLQAIVSLRASGYCQAVLETWFNEPRDFMADRIAKHQTIRDDLADKLNLVNGISVRVPDAGSYLFPEIPELEVHIEQFVKIVRELAGVTITPGTEFGSGFTRHFRINFSQDHEAAIAEILKCLPIKRTPIRSCLKIKVWVIR